MVGGGIDHGTRGRVGSPIAVNTASSQARSLQKFLTFFHNRSGFERIHS